ncbi:hypothetical protein CCHR01_15700 [Colletotrichum chrysophilum]|uniref:Uncharacterized protein n=1 Tax=Colletotrichum chrysophilum TaxID=1836956 RepID=A0AAD9A5U3_9PEZI|nr:hypothetical protein CCHR01_15700 [Colletotrichum chrysophilum]
MPPRLTNGYRKVGDAVVEGFARFKAFQQQQNKHFYREEEVLAMFEDACLTTATTTATAALSSLLALRIETSAGTRAAEWSRLRGFTLSVTGTVSYHERVRIVVTDVQISNRQTVVSYSWDLLRTQRSSVTVRGRVDEKPGLMLKLRRWRDRIGGPLRRAYPRAGLGMEANLSFATGMREIVPGADQIGDTGLVVEEYSSEAASQGARQPHILV